MVPHAHYKARPPLANFITHTAVLGEQAGRGEATPSWHHVRGEFQQFSQWRRRVPPRLPALRRDLCQTSTLIFVRAEGGAHGLEFRPRTSFCGRQAGRTSFAPLRVDSSSRARFVGAVPGPASAIALPHRQVSRYRLQTAGLGGTSDAASPHAGEGPSADHRQPGGTRNGNYRPMQSRDDCGGHAALRHAGRGRAERDGRTEQDHPATALGPYWVGLGLLSADRSVPQCLVGGDKAAVPCRSVACSNSCSRASPPTLYL